MSSALLAMRGWRISPPLLRLRWRDVRQFTSFGAYQTGERVVNFLGSNIDYLLVGRFLGPAALGAYAIAYQLVTLPQTRLNPVITRVAFPALALKRREPETQRRGYSEMVRLLATVMFPAMIGLAAVAPTLIPAVYGDKWVESVPLVQVGSILGAVFAVSNPQGSLFLAMDRPDIGFKLNLWRTALLAVTIGVAVQYGVLTVAWAFALTVLALYVAVGFMFNRWVGISPARYFAPLSKPLALSAVMGGAAFATGKAVSATSAPDLIVLGAQVVVGVGLYAALMSRFDRDYLGTLRRLLSQSLGRSA